jgi:hypothetical protein
MAQETYLRKWSWWIDHDIIIDDYNIDRGTLDAGLWSISSRWYTARSLVVWDSHTAGRYPHTSSFCRGWVQVWKLHNWLHIWSTPPLRNPPASIMEVHSVGAEDTGFSKANQTLHFTDISVMYKYNPYSVGSHYYHPTTISEHNKIAPLFLEKWHRRRTNWETRGQGDANLWK